MINIALPKGRLGKKCYELFHGQLSPCKFCNNHLLSSDNFYNWEFGSAMLDKQFLSKAKLIEVDGRLLRMEITTETGVMKAKEAAANPHRKFY